MKNEVILGQAPNPVSFLIVTIWKNKIGSQIL